MLAVFRSVFALVCVAVLLPSNSIYSFTWLGNAALLGNVIPLSIVFEEEGGTSGGLFFWDQEAGFLQEFGFSMIYGIQTGKRRSKRFFA